MIYPSFGSSSALLLDSEGFNALNIAVLTGDAAITGILFEDLYHSKEVEKRTNNSHVRLLPGVPLTTALKLDSFTYASNKSQ